MTAWTAEILSQGDEVVTGQIADTNAAWLADRLTALGFDVVRHTAVGDRVEDIAAMIREAGARSDLVVGTGGLGPTDDDLTADAVAQVAGVELVFDPVAMQAIEERYRRLNRAMPAVNRKQALLPAGWERLDNAWGTAPGFAGTVGKGWFAFLPGVPREMKPMFEERVLPRILARLDVAAGRLVTLRTLGVGESDLQVRLQGYNPAGVVIGYRTILPENLVKLRFAPEATDAQVREVVAEVAHRLGEPVYAVEGLDRGPTTLGKAVGEALLARGETVAVAESCTGGQISALFTSVPGSSQWFLEGAVTYSNASKTRQLGVSAELMAEHGAVSEPVARAMAEGMKARSGATWAIATTGIAGPSGGTDDKPVGTVHLAISGPDGTVHQRLQLGKDRDRVQGLALGAAFDALRRRIGLFPASS